jgi:acyl-CoA thioester hydrolase
MSEIDLTDRAAFRFWADERVRFNDLDALGHVNNNLFGVYFETARVAFLNHLGFTRGPVDPALVVVRTEIDFRVELHYPADLKIGLSLLKLGNTSMTYGLGVFTPNVCHATCRAVLVRLDAETRRPTPLTESERIKFGAYLYKTENPI